MKETRAPSLREKIKRSKRAKLVEGDASKTTVTFIGPASEKRPGEKPG